MTFVYVYATIKLLQTKQMLIFVLSLVYTFLVYVKRRFQKWPFRIQSLTYWLTAGVRMSVSTDIGLLYAPYKNTYM